MVDREVHDMIREDLARLSAQVQHLHTPGDCPLRLDLKTLDERVRAIQLREAWRSGIWAVIGGFVALGGFSGLRAVLGF